MSFISSDLLSDRLGNFIIQITTSVLKMNAGVYIIVANDEFCEATQTFKRECEANIKYVQDADVPKQEEIAKKYNCDSIVKHLQTRRERTHTMVLSYACKNRAGDQFSMSGPI